MATIKESTRLCKNCRAAQSAECGCNAGFYRLVSFDCDRCNKEVTTSGGRDVDCRNCGACYNGSGQRLRDDWRGNMSNYDENVSDMDGFEMQHAGD